MDLATVLGFVAGVVFLLLTIFNGADFDISKTRIFLDMPSVMCVFGGTLAGTLIAFPFDKLANGLKATKNIFLSAKEDPVSEISNLITLANMARREGILSLEDAVAYTDDEFLQKGVMLIVDGTDPELVRNILETEISYIEGRHTQARSVWEFISLQGPAWGMIGTVIGLILMLNDLTLTIIGPAMSVAVITTLYGAVLANFIANPIISKLKIHSAAEVHIKEVVTEGILSIQAGENPRIIEEKLRAFLSPAIRRGIDNQKDDLRIGDEYV